MIRHFLILTFAVFHCAAQELKFTRLDPWYFKSKFYGIAYGAGRFVAVGENTTLMSLDNGQTWVRGKNVPPMTFQAVVWAGTKFVAVGEGNKTIYSEDGLNWNVSALPKSYRLTGIAWDSQTGNFITSGQLLFSGDGVSWRETPYSNVDVAAGQGRFIAVSGDYQTVGISEDGLSWRWSKAFPRFHDSNCTNNPLECPIVTSSLGATYAQGAFLVELHYTTYRFPLLNYYTTFTSSDGQTWATLNAQEPRGYYPCTVNNSILFASSVGCYRVAGTNDTLAGVTEGGGILVHSPPSPFWLPRPVPAQGRLSSIAVNGAVSVGVGAGGIIVSTNSLAWNSAVQLPDGTDGLRAVRFGGGAFVAVGKSGTVIRSTDGLNWSKRVSNTSYDLNDLTFGNGRWVGVGAGGRVITSTNGSRFSLRFAPTDLELTGVTFGPEQFVAVGKGGSIMTSANGEEWVGVGSEAIDLFGVAFGGGKFLAVGINGVTMSSTTGSTWIKGQIPGGKSVTRVAYANGFFVANEAGTTTLYVSKDGAAWEPQAVGTSVLFGVDATDGEIWVTGDNIEIWRTSQSEAFAPKISAARQGANGIAFNVVAPVLADYEIQSATSLTSGSWQTATILGSIEGNASWIKNDAVDSRAFYRVVRR